MGLVNFPRLKDILTLPDAFASIPDPFAGLEEEVGALGFPPATRTDLVAAGLTPLPPALAGLLLNPAAVGIVVSFFAFLERQARDKLKPIPEPLRDRLKPFYAVDLDTVRYAEGIDTLQEGNAVTVDRHIFFPEPIDLTKRGDAHWLFHELQHCVQYAALGGKVPFLRKYLGQVVDGVVKSRTFNVHDLLELEREADATADRVDAQLGPLPGG
jgi:hypothetical protein